jgi:hypothetical protein
MTEEVVIRSARSDDDRLTFRAQAWDATLPDPYEGPAVTIEVESPGLHAVAVLPAIVAGLEHVALLLHEIDRDWRGWQGSKTTQVDRDWFAVSAAHDGLGHVVLAVRLSDGWPMDPGWSVETTISIDVGSAAAHASAMDRWNQVVWPSEGRWGDVRRR